MKQSNFKLFETIVGSIIKYFKYIVIGAILLIVLSGIYKVDSNEVAVVLRFGKLVGETYEEQVKTPGLHFSFPNIIDEVIKIQTQQVKEMTVKTHYNSSSAIDSDIKSNGYVITGDSNIVLVEAVIKYTVSDPIQYALYISDIEKAVDGIVSGEMTSTISSMNVDSILTNGKATLSSDLKKNVQKCIDEMNLGITVTNVELTSVMPPLETKEFFDAVNVASVKKQTKIQEANDYSASKIPEAEAEADALVKASSVNQSERLTKARADIAEFDGLFQQYLLNPDVIKNSVFRTRTSAVLARAGAVIIVPDEESSPKIILP